MNLNDCHNYSDFRKLAKKKLPSPIFHYIDGAADDEITYARNTSAFDDVDLVPNVLRGVENIDLSTTIFGKKLDLPFYLAPTALQSGLPSKSPIYLFHYQTRQVAAIKYTMPNTSINKARLPFALMRNLTPHAWKHISKHCCKMENTILKTLNGGSAKIPQPIPRKPSLILPIAKGSKN